jgi:hypothetical protein
MNYSDEEQLSVSSQSDSILESTFEQFQKLLSEGRQEDAFALGKEYHEWIVDMENEELLFFNVDEFKEMIM